MIIENSAKAIIVNNNSILLIKNMNQYGIGDWYCLPGGRQKPGENLLDALKRECREEISIVPIIEKLLFVREYIHENHRLRNQGKPSHKIEFMFLCSINSSEKPILGTSPDISQKNIEWIDLNKIHNTNIFPTKLKEMKNLLKTETPVYWGDIL